MRWPVRVVAVTGSTNADLLAAARGGDRGPRVLAARRQDTGRGRLGRAWSSPDGASLAVSWLWVPERPQTDWPWLPMVVGLGVVDAVAVLGVRAGLKWPNDVVVPRPDGPHAPGDAGAPRGATSGLAKLAGVLVEVGQVPGGRAAVVAGVGLNLAQDRDGLPVPTATSLLLERGTAPGFEAALAALTAAVQDRLDRWSAGGQDVVLRRDYRAACTTLSRTVRVRTPGGEVRGSAEDVDDDGCLVVRTPDGARRRVSAGDVEHVR